MEGKRGSAEGAPTVMSSLSSRENSVRRSSKGQQQEEATHSTASKKLNLPDETTVGCGAAIVSSKSDQLHKRDSQRELKLNIGQATADEQGSPKSQKKFISTWRMACDKTKDRTKELLKRWRTMPEGVVSQAEDEKERPPLEPLKASNQEDRGWSVHVWATWVKRYPNDEDSEESDKPVLNLTLVQKEKLSHFFSHIFDMDRDDIISLQDFESFSERLRHFADWSSNSGESVILEQVQQGFIETFILPLKPDNNSETENIPPVILDRLFLSLDEWLCLWSDLLLGVKNFQDLPVWLQYFPKVIFLAINKSGTGVISRDELSAFYSSVMGFSAQRVAEVIEDAYKSMTANGDFKLTYQIYRLCFSNFLIGRFPNGPGQYLFGYANKSTAPFPIDYSAMNTLPEDLEQYTPNKKSNRSSIIV
ncbi:hypothetical protein O3M35_006801 [Rhynocoris fuscipes]|uniref:Uncharacterized protein n=1 Tax=Rhynocoris fuscipes TaxID=488301 RepID=A0AAW1DES9_9HEMI